MKTARDVISQIFEDSPFFRAGDNGDEPIRGSLNLTDSRLVVVTGENATGKSFLRRVISGRLRKNRIEAIHLSQEGRSASGFASACIYGDEEWQSTGTNSSHTILTAFRTARERKAAHGLVFDEPDIGLSDAYAAGAGMAIADFVRDIPDKTAIVVVMTHRKALIKQLLPVSPSHIHLGEHVESLQAWMDMEVVPKPIAELSGKSHALFKKITPVLNEFRAKNKR